MRKAEQLEMRKLTFELMTYSSLEVLDLRGARKLEKNMIKSENFENSSYFGFFFFFFYRNKFLSHMVFRTPGKFSTELKCMK